MKKIVLAILIICLVLGVASFIRLSVPNTPKLTSGNTEQIPSTSESSKISTIQLAVHNKQSDCWIAYDGKVYDVTSFLPRHPGSAAAISPFCGTSDGFTQAFTAKHGTSKVGNLMKVGTLIGDFDIVGKV